MVEPKNQMQDAGNNELKQALTTCSKQRLRAFNGTNDRTSPATGCDST